MKKIITPAVILGILFGLCVAFFVLENIRKSQSSPGASRSDDHITINSFDSCVLANYPVQESYPRRCVLPDGTAFTEELENVEYDIVLETPRPNESVTSPLSIKGEAVGPWFFEANFSAELVDADGKVLGTAILSANGEWMTVDLVPFEGELSYENGSGEAELILKSANPSGLAENQKIFSIPVRLN